MKFTHKQIWALIGTIWIVLFLASLNMFFVWEENNVSAARINNPLEIASHGEIVDLNNQSPITTDPTIITFDTSISLHRFIHVTPSEFVARVPGDYLISIEYLAGKAQGGVKETHTTFFQVDRGNGFINVSGSRRQAVIKDAEIPVSVTSMIILTLKQGDKIRAMQTVSNIGLGLGLKTVPATINEPSVASVKMLIARIGN